MLSKPLKIYSKGKNHILSGRKALEEKKKKKDLSKSFKSDPVGSNPSWLPQPPLATLLPTSVSEPALYHSALQ